MTETLPIVLAVRLEVIRYKTVSVLRKGILAAREEISVASVIEVEIEEALAIEVVLAIEGVLVIVAVPAIAMASAIAVVLAIVAVLATVAEFQIAAARV